MFALAGSNDLRDIEAAAEKTNLASNVSPSNVRQCHQKYIGNFTAQMNGLDALVFTAGIGENSKLIRKLVTTNMEYLGISIDPHKTFSPKRLKEISVRQTPR